MARAKFAKNKTYYLEGESWKLKFIDQALDGYYNFKVIEHNDPDDDWMEYSTKDGSEILSDRSEWLQSIKDKEPTKPGDNDGVSNLQSTVAALGEEI